MIGQDDAKKFLSVAVYNHYKRLMQPSSDDVEIEKSNIVPVIYPSSVERTSFAERGETKAFVELHFSGRERLFRHVPLPARPMVDLPVCGATRARVLASLADAVVHAPADAVVRIMGPPQARALLNARALDEVVPLGMSVAHHVAPAA